MGSGCPHMSRQKMPLTRLLSQARVELFQIPRNCPILTLVPSDPLFVSSVFFPNSDTTLINYGVGFHELYSSDFPPTSLADPFHAPLWFVSSAHPYHSKGSCPVLLFLLPMFFLAHPTHSTDFNYHLYVSPRAAYPVASWMFHRHHQLDMCKMELSACP